jgi:Zn-dependent protease
MEQNLFENVLIWLVPALTGIVVHEVAHGWVAWLMGDPTAKDAGRLSLNPLRHIDPFGTIILPLLMIVSNLPFLFGWAKPVPVNFTRLRHKRLGTFLVALAGPASNALMIVGWLALLWPLAAAESYGAPSKALTFLIQVAVAGIAINLALIVFNLIPILPLDGGRIVSAFLPPPLSRAYMKLEKYGLVILILLLVTGLFGKLFTPIFIRALKVLESFAQ